ncbi:MAG: Hpt domain-containing protein [Caulobacteraceae bacterium]|nr:Hpt domain-containing protein [Caulobacter sp.]RYF91928.1 MAG: Hpt domain-containing protein [Caulobacteraceae bacterium]
MSSNTPVQVINAPNTLKLRLGGGKFGGIDAAAIAKAEAALKSLSGNFSEWMQDELTKLEAARQAIRVSGLNAETAEGLYFRAHDLKGLGATYEFPLVTRIAASLCKLIDDPDTRVGAPMFLVDAHIDAIRAAVRDDIKTDTHPVGKVLITELERRVAEIAPPE